MYFATAQEMAKLDDVAVASGLEIRQMMELAGWHILSVLRDMEITPENSISILVGKGNKGGDGLSAARHLINSGYKPNVFLVSDDRTKDANHQLQLIRSSGFVHNFNGEDPWQTNALHSSDLIIDALVGYRLDGPLRGPVLEAVNTLNQTNSKVVSYDIPTGISADGTIFNPHVKADATLMLALAKKVAQTDSRAELGTIYLADIGISAALYQRVTQDPNSRPRFLSHLVGIEIIDR